MFVRSLAKVSDDPIVKGGGITIETASGKQLLDLTTGTLCMPFGYSWRDSFGAAACSVIDNIPFASSRFGTPFIERFADEFLQRLPEELNTINPKMCNGSDAVETAVKAARVYSGREGVAVVKGAWHGETSLCLSLSSRSFMRENGGKSNIHVSEEPNLQSLIELIHEKKYELGAVIIDPVGFSCGLFDESTLRKDLFDLRAACDLYGTVLIFDEVQSAIFSFPHFTAMEKYGVVPDIAAFGKALGFGVMPVAATVFKSKFRDVLQYNEAEFTYGAQPAALTVALKGLGFLHDRRDSIESSIGIGLNVLDNLQERYQDDFEVRRNGVFATITPKGRYFRSDWVSNFVRDSYKAGIVVRSNDAGNRIALKLPIYCNPIHGEFDRAEAIMNACMESTRPFVQFVNRRGFDSGDPADEKAAVDFQIVKKPLIVNKNLGYLQTIFDKIGSDVQPQMRAPDDQEAISTSLNDLGFPIQRVFASQAGDAVYYYWAEGVSLDKAVVEHGLSGEDLVGVLLRHQRLIEHANDNEMVIADRWPGNVVIDDDLNITFIDLDIKLLGESLHTRVVADETFALMQSCALAARAGVAAEAAEVLVPRYVSRHGKEGQDMLRKATLYYTHNQKPSNSSSFDIGTYEEASAAIENYLMTHYGRVGNIYTFPQRDVPSARAGRVL
jgi:acetylornithine/succinyldiaminopimelate/putrescine aminotransferase